MAFLAQVGVFRAWRLRVGLGRFSKVQSGPREVWCGSGWAGLDMG